MNTITQSCPSSILTGPISTRLKPWLLPAALLAATFPVTPRASAASVTWDGGTSGTGTEFGTAVNWSSDTLPAVNGGTAAFAGTVAGNLALTYYTTTLAGSAGDAGINFYLSASQTGNVVLDGTNSIRMGNVTIDAGAGAFTLGDGVSSSGNLTLNFGRVNSDRPIWTNNSSNVATINSDVGFGAGGGVPKTLTFDGSGNWQVNANLTTGTGTALTVTKTGSGALTLSASSSLIGGIALNGGTLNVNHASALGSGTLTLSATGATPISINNTSAGAITLVTNNAQTWGSDFTFVGTKDLNLGTGAVTLNGNRTVTVSAGNLTVGGAISGSGTLNKSGAGALTLSGSSSFTGGIALKAGPLNINHAYALGTGTLTLSATGATPISIDNTSAGALTLAGNNPQSWAGDFTFTGTKDLNLGTGAVTVTGDRTVTVSAGTLTVGGAITSSGNLTKAGGGTLVLGGSNSISGNLAINAGMLSISSTTALPGWNTNGKYSVASGATFAVGNALTNADITSILGTTNFLAGAAIGLDTTAGDRTISTAIGDTAQGALGLTKLGSNTLFLTGTNTYTGNTTITSGMLSISSTSALPGWNTNGRYSVASGVTLVVSNALTDANVTSMLGTTNFLAGAAIGYDTTTGDRTVSAVIANTAQGALGLTKLGANTLTLTGTSTYTGPTTISSGTLQLGNGTTDGVISTSSGITNNGALVFNQVGTQSYSNPISGTGTLTKNGAGTLVLNTTNPFSGVTTINAGSLQIGNGTVDGSIAGPIVDNANLSFYTAGSKTYAGVISGTGTVNKYAAGTLTLTGSNTYTGVTTVNAGTLQIGDGTTDGSIAGPIVDSANLIFQTVGSRTYGNLISGTGTLNKTGAGTLTLTGTHTYTGVTTVSSGTLQLGDGTTNGSIPSTAWVADNGVVVFNVSGNQTVGQWFISGGLIVKTGTGTLTLTGNNTQGAGTTISAGVLSISSTAALSNWSTNGKYSVASGATLAVANAVTDANVTTMLSTTNFQVGAAIGYDTSSGNRTVSTAIGDTAQGMLGLTKIGVNTLTLAGTNTYTGNTSVNAGTLSISSTSALPGWNVSGRYTVASGATLAVTNTFAASDVSSMLATTNFAAGAAIGFDTAAGSRTVSTVLAGLGVNLTKIGSNILTLTGSNTYTGTTTISAGGTLSVGDGTTDGSIASSSGIVDGGALAYNLLGSQTFAGSISGNGSLTKSGSGTLILTGSNSYSGNTTISTGILNIRNSYALGPGTLNNSSVNGELQVQGNITLDSSRNYTLSNNGAGVGLVAIRNVSGTNTLQGAITVTGGGGGLAVQSDSGLISLNTIGTNVATRALIFGGSGNGVVNGNITDVGGGATLTKNGVGTWILSGSDSYTGITTINGGVLQANNANALTSGTAAIVFGGGTLQYTSASAGQDWSGRIKNSTAGAIALDLNGQSVTFASSIDSSNTGGLTQSGGGTLTLAASNGFTGTTTVSSGTLKLGGNLSLQNSTLNLSSAGTLDLTAANTPTFVTLSGSGNITAAANVTGITLTAASGSATYSGNLSGGTGMSLTKSGSATLILSGSNSYTGTTTISAGALTIASPDALPGWDTPGRYSIASGVTLGITNAVSDARIATMAATGNIASGVLLQYDTSAGNRISTAVPSGLGLALKVGANTLTLTDPNTYAVSTKVAGGTLAFANSIGANSIGSVTLSGGAAGANLNISGATNLNGGTLTVGNASGDRSVAVISADTTMSTLSIGNALGSSGALYLTAGTLTHVVGTYASENFAQNGYGYLNVSGGTLTGAAFFQSGNWNSGPTGVGVITQSGGTVTQNTGQPFILGGVNVAGGTGVLNMDGGVMTESWTIGSGWDTTTSGRGEFNISGGSITAGDFGFHGTTTGVLNLKGGTLSVPTVHTYTGNNNANSVGYVNFHGGTLQATTDGAILINLATANTQNNVFIYSEGATIDTNGKNVTVVNGFNAPTGNGISSIALTGSGAGYIGEPYVQITGGGGSGATARATIDPATGLVTGIVVTNPGTGYTSTPTVTLVGGGSTTPATLGTVTTAANVSGGLTKSGSGTLTLTGTSSYTGLTTINAGTLQIGNGTTDGSISTSSGVVNNGTLAFNLTGNLTMPWAISGSGALTKSGGGTVIVTASNSYTGATTISAGALELGDGTAGHDGSLATSSISNNSLLKFNFYGVQTVAYPIIGYGTIQTIGAGTVIFTGSNSAGAVSVNAGTLQLGDGTAGNDGVFSPSYILNNSALVYNQAGNQSAGYVISGTGTVTKLGAGTLSLTASNSYSGITTISAGTLQLGDGTTGHDGSLATSGVINNSALSYNLFGSQTVSYAINGSGNLTKAGVGTLVLSSSNGYSGATSINAGTLQANNASALGTGNITFGGGMLQYTSVSAGTDWSARIKNSTGAIALDTGTNNVSFASPLASSNMGGLTKNGSGTLILTGSNGFAGLITINGGFVQLGNGTTDGSISAAGAITTGWGTNVSFNVAGSQTYAGSISGNGTLWKSGSGTLTLTGSSSYIWSTHVDAGIVNLQNSYALGPGTTNCANYNAELQLQGNITLDSSRTFSMSNNGTGAAGLVGFRNVSGTNTIQGAISVVGGGGGLAMQSDSGLLIFTGNLTTANVTRTLFFQGAANGIFSGDIIDAAGGATLTKKGAGTWTLSGSDSYTGATTISGGTLQLGDGTKDGSILGSSAIANNAALVYNVSGSQTSANVISGSGTVAKAGTGTLNLSGSNTYSGGTTLNNGTLQLGSAKALGTGGLAINGGTLDLAGNSVKVGVFRGSGGTITNSGSNTSTLTIAVASGTSTYAGNIADGAGTVVLTNSGAGTLTLSGSLAMSGLNANNGVTQLTQSGSVGAISISAAGKLELTTNGVNTAKVLDTSSLSIAAGGTLDLWDNALILRDQTAGGNQATNLSTVQGLVNTAFDNGNWDKPGITSSSVIADLGAYSVLTVMVYDNTVLGVDSFEGINNLMTDNGGNQVMLKVTYLGDFDGNGIVNSADYGWLDFYYGYGLTVGDLNGDGQVNSADYNGIDYGYGYQAYGVLSGTPAAGVTAASAPAPAESVPEPGTLGLLLAGAVGLLGFRGKVKRSVR